MAVVTSSWLADCLLLTATLLYLLYRYFNSTADYFKDRGIPYLRPLPFIGELRVFTKPQHELSKFLYNTFPNERFYGFFQSKVPTLVVKDPDLVHRIMIKDFGNFHDRGFPTVETDPLTRNLFNLKGNTWRVLRQKLIPTFSTGKLKTMFDEVNKCGDSLVLDVDKVALTGEPVNTRMFIFNFTAEVIASVAFGIDFSRNNPQSIEFISNINHIFKMTIRQMLLLFCMLVAPKLVNYLELSTFSKRSYFVDLIKATKEFRVKNNVKRNDYFQLLLTLQENERSGKTMAPAATTADSNEEDSLINQMDYVPEQPQSEAGIKLFTDEGVTAQSFVFLTAGSDSVSSTLELILYHISKDQMIQTRLQEEVDTVLKKHGNYTYQAVKDMTFMDQVIQEAQRMHPIVPLTMRQCTESYAIPDSKIVIEKGTIIAIPLTGLQNDPKYYPSPETFDPSRFDGNNHKPNSTFMPFGDGPRICIAMRFAILEVKVCLSKILEKYSVEISSKTQEPFVYDRESFFPRPKGGIWVHFKKRAEKSS